MTPGQTDDVISRRKTARVAGFLYVLLGIIAPIGLVYVPGRLFVPGDATATADHIRGNCR